jgi:hypothetical protein
MSYQPVEHYLSELTEGAVPVGCPGEGEIEQLFAQTVDYWHRWLAQCTYTGRWREMVYRILPAPPLRHIRCRGEIPTDDLAARNELGDIFVRGANHNLIDTCFAAEAERCGSERIVGLELNHRPDYNPQGSNRLLGQRELGQQLWGNTLTGLVAWEEAIAERLDHVIEGTGYVCSARFGEKHKQAVEQAKCGADFAAVESLSGRCSEVAAEKFVGAVYKVKLHCNSPRIGKSGCCGSSITREVPGLERG